MFKKILIMLILLSLSGCTQSPDFVPYKGKSLRIAILGEQPKVKEGQVSFTEISFDDLSSSKEWKQYDAVFVMREKLSEAAEGQYANTYLTSPIPIFFISASSHIPFTVEETEYNKSWEWSPGKGYATGFFPSPKEGSNKYWEYGLYNDEKTNEHIMEVYSRIFKTIDELTK